MELKQVLRRYLICLVVILCLGGFFLGTVRVREKTRFNMDMTAVETVRLAEHEQGLSLYFGDKKITFRSEKSFPFVSVEAFF